MQNGIQSMGRDELAGLIADLYNGETDELFKHADRLRRAVYGDGVYLRGLIEFSNYCRNNCYYCGIRRDNRQVRRYRLSKEEILSCCHTGYGLGFRTFVLQSGEDPYFTDDLICDVLTAVKERYPDCAVTLSIGEKNAGTYHAYRMAGADRYLLRHETADGKHYARLHPPEMRLSDRKSCLYRLKELGFQVGAGFMVGSPGQTMKHLARDLLFLKELQPHMVGIGPFIPHSQTPFAGEPQGSLKLTLIMVALTRLMLPQALIPSTTALGTIHPTGREQGLQAGANVVMPNLSPVSVRKDYALYNNKICTGDETAECRACLERRVKGAGYFLLTERGDHISLV